MATPSPKSAMMEALIDDMSLSMYGRSRTESIKSDICVVCGEDATLFTDARGQLEYTISGMCQRDQDKTFK